MTLQFPTGTIRTFRPYSQNPYGIPWSQVSRWQPSWSETAVERGLPEWLLPLMSVIESDSRQFDDAGRVLLSKDDGSGVLAEGIMQVKPRFWQHLAPDADHRTAAGNIRLAGAIMADAMRTRTWQRAIAEVYHPGADPNSGTDPAGYVATIEKLRGELTMPDLVFKTLRPPTYITRIVPKPWEGAGFDRVPPRNNVGMCMHKWWGYGDELSLYRLFGTGGERQADALTDWSITQEGVVTLLNEPWGTRAGWANGPANHLEGDGVQFVRQLGVGAVNSRLVSVEFEGKDEPLTEQQMEKGSSLWAYYYDQWEVPYTEYPMNPKVGLVTDLDHWEIGDKQCPFAGARAQRSQFQDRVRGKLKAAQTKEGTTEPIPPVNPPQPDHSWIPDGMTEDVVEGLFGTLERVNPDGSVVEVGFDPKGIISNAWLARGADLKLYPEAQRWFRLQDGSTVRNVVSFSSGWVLMGTDGDRASWKWL